MEPSEAPPIRQQKRRRRGTKLPRWFYVVLLGCVAAVAVALIVQPGRRILDSGQVIDTPNPYTEGLTLEGVHFDPPQGERRIVGVIRNAGSEPVRNVSLSLALWVLKTGEAGRRQVEIAQIPARGEVAFTTEPVPSEVYRWSVESLLGEK